MVLFEPVGCWGAVVRTPGGARGYTGLSFKARGVWSPRWNRGALGEGLGIGSEGEELPRQMPGVYEGRVLPPAYFPLSSLYEQ